MAIGRMLNKRVSKSPDMNGLPDDTARLLITWIIPHLDRDGLIEGEAVLIKGTVFPWRADLTTEQIDGYLEAAREIGLIRRYSVDGRQYIWFPKFRDNQPNMRYDREAPSEFPPPPGYMRTEAGLEPEPSPTNSVSAPAELRSNSGVTPEVLRQNSGATPLEEKRSRREGKGRESATAIAAPPPEAPPKTSKRTKRPTPPAVQVFREAAHRYPARSWWTDVVQAVGDDPDDLAFWEQCVKAYVGLGWNPTNVKAMLEFYARREIPNGKAKRRHDEPTYRLTTAELQAEWDAATHPGGPDPPH